MNIKIERIANTVSITFDVIENAPFRATFYPNYEMVTIPSDKVESVSIEPDGEVRFRFIEPVDFDIRIPSEPEPFVWEMTEISMNIPTTAIDKVAKAFEHIG